MLNQLGIEMIAYFGNDVRRVNHFLKVHSFAKLIGTSEKLTEREQFLLESTAYLHDIGIKISEEKYQSSNGKYQESEGPKEAEKLLLKLKYTSADREEIKFMIGNHHTYSAINSLPFQILVEADFLVNIFEDEMGVDAIHSVKDKIFKTDTGIQLLESLYL